MRTFLNVSDWSKSTTPNVAHRFIVDASGMKRPSFRKHAFQRSGLISTQFLVSMPRTNFYANQSDQDLVGLLTSQYLQSSGWLESIRTR